MGCGRSHGGSAVQNPRVQVAGLGVRRITNRCSGPGNIKCQAAGEDALRSSHRFRARVPTKRRLAAAELNRYTTDSVEFA
jgi:hypothetical protein